MAQLPHQMRVRGQLMVHAHAGELDVSDPIQLDVELRVRRVPDRGERLTLVFIIAEEMRLVLRDRAADGPADLLIGVREDAVEYGILGVPVAVPEIGRASCRVR